MAALPRSKVLIAVPALERVVAVGSLIPQAELHFAGTSDALLNMLGQVTPDLVVVSVELPTLVPFAELLAMLRSRDDLTHSMLLVVDVPPTNRTQQGLLSAGADALLGMATPEALAAQILNLLGRSRELRQLAGRAAQLQVQLGEWEHEERVRDQLVHMLVHDLKNPITAILGLLDLVRTDERVPPDLAELLKLSQEEAQHLLHLSVNMLDVRKIQAGKMQLKPELLFAPMLKEVIDRACGDVGSGLSDRQISIHVPKNLSPVQADPEILRRVFANLISNALKHTRAGGHIGVTCQEVGDRLQFTVADDGEGIPAEDIPNLFAAFEQSRLTLHGRFDTGMGLAFCKLAVEGHGGRIWVDSVRGQGSQFHFVIPLDQPEDEDDDVELLF